LPVALAIFFWVLTNAVVEHSPLYFLTSVYGNPAQTRVIGSRPESWLGAARLIFVEVAHLYPAYPLCAVVALSLAVWRRQTVVGATLVVMTSTPLLLMGYLAHQGSLDHLLRYFLSAIPGSFVLAAYSIGLVRRRGPRTLLGLALLIALAASSVASLAAMSNSTLGGPGMESAGVAAATENRPLANDTYAGRIHEELGLGRAVERLDAGHKLILIDAFLGFPIVINSPDPKLFVVTSDESFEAALNHPQAYGIGYFLVPYPGGEGRLDAINRRYPGFWRDGDHFATKVAEFGGGTVSYKWRLYKIVGPAPQ
jgi:hypothetical protein